MWSSTVTTCRWWIGLHRERSCGRAAFHVICLGTLTLLLGSSASADDRVIEQRIQRIQNGLLSPVLVRGESIQSTPLSTRMELLHIPGISIAVIHGGKLEWARGFGVTRSGGPPVTPETLFQAASISKPVTALAVMNLVQRRKLDLDADVNQYLKSWKLPTNEFTQQANVTLRGLLTHSAGVTVHGFAGYEAGAPLPSLVQVLDGQAPANNAAIRADMVPGKTWRYSGGGFVIAQQVLTDVTDVPFPKLMHNLVLRPLGMKHSTYEQPLSRELIARAATPHRADGTPVPGGPHVYPELAAASLWTTPSDLARYAIGVQEALAGTSKRVVSAATARAMLAPAFDQQAIGLVVGGSAARPWFNHGGSNAGYRCLLVAYQDGDGAVIMTNSENGHELIVEILRTIAHEYAWPDYAPPERTLATVESQSFDRYVGAYRFASGATVTFWRNEGHIKSRIWGQPAVAMFPTSEREYFLKAVDARWVFSTGVEDADVAATLYQDGHEQLAKRLDDVEGRPALDVSIATEERFKEQTPAPGSEAALRRLIAGLVSGKPDYEDMRPGFAEIVRRKLSELQASLARLGSVQSFSFEGVGPAGDDAYSVKFEHGARDFHILLLPDGRIHAAQFSP